jgi:hypothetical protein
MDCEGLFPRHDWNKWEQYTWSGKVGYTGLLIPEHQRGVMASCVEERQRRTCKKCGFKQDRKVNSN